MAKETKENVDRGDLLALTSDIVSAHLANNSVAMADVPHLIEQVYYTLTKLGAEPPEEPVE